MSNERKRMFELAYKLAENLELAHGMTLDKREVAAGFTPIITEFLAADLWHDSQPVAAPQPDSLGDFIQRVGKELGRRTNLLELSLLEIRRYAEEELRANSLTIDQLNSVEVRGGKSAIKGRTDGAGSTLDSNPSPVADPVANNVEQTDVIDNSAKIAEIRARLEACHWVDNSDEGVGKFWKWLFDGGLHNEHASFLAQAQRDVALLLCEIDNRTSRPVADPVAPLVEALRELLFGDPQTARQNALDVLAAYEGRRQ